MHNSFILQQYVCYTMILNMFRAAVRSPPAYCTVVYREWRYQRLWWYNLSSWGWAACCSKHVEDHSVTYISLKNKGIVHYFGNLKKSKHSFFAIFVIAV